jgi:PBP1b-binding outer membrane lipoprotein LpoB
LKYETWRFGGDINLKKIIILSVVGLAFFISGCSKESSAATNPQTPQSTLEKPSNENVKSTAETKSTNDATETHIKQNEQSQNSLNHIDGMNKAKLLRDDIKNSVNEKSKEQITQMVKMLVAKQEEECNIYNEVLAENFYKDLIDKNYDYLEDIKESNAEKDKPLKEFIIMIENAGYEINFYEGYIPVVDFSYDSIYVEFKDYITSEYKDYFEIEFIDSPFGAEGILVAELDELVNMTENAFKFLTNYPNSIYKEDITGIYRIYLRTYLEPYSGEGQNFEDKAVSQFSETHIKSFREFVNRHEGTEAADVVGKYLILLSECNYEYTESAEKFIKDNCGEW